MFFFFNDPATTEIYTLSLQDALPIFKADAELREVYFEELKKKIRPLLEKALRTQEDRKSTRLNSSHMSISYAVFCLKKKKIQTKEKGYDFYSGFSEVINAMRQCLKLH